MNWGPSGLPTAGSPRGWRVKAAFWLVVGDCRQTVGMQIRSARSVRFFSFAVATIKAGWRSFGVSLAGLCRLRVLIGVPRATAKLIAKRIVPGRIKSGQWPWFGYYQGPQIGRFFWSVFRHRPFGNFRTRREPSICANRIESSGFRVAVRTFTCWTVSGTHGRRWTSNGDF
jgi:hypothetical protein